MTIEIIYKKAVNDGVNFALTDDGKVRLSGDKNAVNRWSPIIRENKQAIITLLTRKHESTIRAWLNEIGEPENDHHIVINKCRHDPEALAYYLEQAMTMHTKNLRKKYKKMLADYPDQNRAYVTDTDTDQDNVIVTVAIRNVASFELQIPKVNYDPFAFAKAIDEGTLH